MSASACIDAPAGVVWAHLARLDQLHLWTDMVHRSYISSACTTGVDAERTCELAGGRRLRERVVAWDEGRSFTYVSADAPMMKLARNTWSVTAIGDRAMVTSDAEFEFRAGWLGRALGWLFLPLMKRLLPNPMVKLKFWVEHGRPFEGKASWLPVPGTIC